ncbi:MAG: DUF5063 domain-containing protein [Caulobacteraceae bacterium]
MTQIEPPAITAAKSYLEMVESGPRLTVRDLARAIDDLVMAVHTAAEGDPADADATPPKRNYKDDYRRLGERFGSLGYYRTAAPLDLESEAVTGDAIDDLVDIGSDLKAVLWRYENNGTDDSLWHFRLLFQIHWGLHARELSLYLHALIQAGDE